MIISNFNLGLQKIKSRIDSESLSYKILLLLEVPAQATSDIKGHRGHNPLQIYVEIAEDFAL